MWPVVREALNDLIVVLLVLIVVFAGIAGYGAVYREARVKYGRSLTIALSILGGIVSAGFIFGFGYVCITSGCPA